MAGSLAGRSQNLPYWLVNVDPSLYPSECPDYLRDLEEHDKAQLGTPDAQYALLGWEQVRQIVETNSIDQFRRVPSELRKYREYTWKLKQRYGSVMRFIVEDRLKWSAVLPQSEVPFASPNDYTVLLNDWPYGLQKSIVHLVVWVKFPLEDDVETGDVTPQTREVIEDFVAKTFRPRLSADKVLWFRNWASIKSIHAVEHFHVLLDNPDRDFVRDITNGDVPLTEKV